MRKTHVKVAPEFEHGSDNVYRDLHFADADEMFFKAQLVSKIDEILRSRVVTQNEAARVLGIPQPRLSRILRGHFQDISEHKLFECLNKLAGTLRSS